MAEPTTVWIVQVNGHINSMWADEADMLTHCRRLVEINGDQLAIRARDFVVREKGVTILGTPRQSG